MGFVALAIGWPSRSQAYVAVASVGLAVPALATSRLPTSGAPLTRDGLVMAMGLASTGVVSGAVEVDFR